MDKNEIVAALEEQLARQDEFAIIEPRDSDAQRGRVLLQLVTEILDDVRWISDKEWGTIKP